MSLPSKKLTLLTLLALISIGAFSQVYKWTDEEGNVQYSDVPPEEGNAETVQIEAHVPQTKTPADTKLLQDAEERYRRLGEEREARAADRKTEEQVERRREELCTHLRKQLISLQQRLPVYRDEEGNFRTLSQYDVYEGAREYLDDATRAREIAGVKIGIEVACENPADLVERNLAGLERVQEKRCEHARVKLKEVLQDKRAPRQEIEEAQASVARYCGTEN